MNWLKKIAGGIGKVFNTAKSVEAVFDPIIQSVFPGVGSALSAVFALVTQTEGLFGAAYGPDAKKGADKLNAVLPFIQHIIENSQILAGKSIVNATRFTDGCKKIIAGVVDILHSVDTAVPVPALALSEVNDPPNKAAYATASGSLGGSASPRVPIPGGGMY